ncbi:Imm52 family immunity protein [Pyxidicoccus sp. 3LG]
MAWTSVQPSAEALLKWGRPARAAAEGDLQGVGVHALRESEWFELGDYTFQSRIEHLGLTVSAYNDGTGPDSASVRMRCGSYEQDSSANACVLSLPSKGETAERILTATVLAKVARSMALAWEPDWAVAMSEASREMDGRPGPADIWLGWVTYLARHPGTLLPLPAPGCHAVPRQPCRERWQSQPGAVTPDVTTARAL